MVLTEHLSVPRAGGRLVYELDEQFETKEQAKEAAQAYRDDGGYARIRDGGKEAGSDRYGVYVRDD